MNSGIRYAVSVVLAVVVTLAAFFFMHKLISGSGGERADVEDPPGIRFGPVEIDDRVETRDRRRPPPPPPPETPPPPPQMEIAQMEQQVQEMPDLDMPELDVSMTGSGPFLGNMGQVDRNEEGDIVPLVRIQPQYPRDAAMNQIEGYVTIEFTIDETGSVRSPRVIDAQPPRIFDRAALRAILRWKFKPRVIDGVATTRQATQTIEFNLDQG
ncbi:energy transducer TonB [Wenzhouxiangella marina]|uniref:Protein TonB n=1 Tax=Wenzhouxiangella marina TaxID=1579979 RepID=A0A0K0XTA8_9GAMM|nr:energy transducer TonB [Wenzhouxiangella marina]AKS40857.1 Periplasmic protein TonB [Wenzhouxiangella marina]MBB6087731.1 protein TonB [Wenzhouxiangella marina]